MVDLKSEDNAVTAGKSRLKMESFCFNNQLGTLPPGTGYRVRIEELADTRSFSSKTQGFSTVIHSGVVANGPDTISRKYPPVGLAAETAAVAGQLYGNGTYFCAESSGCASPACLAFDGLATTSCDTASGTYAPPGGSGAFAYQGTVSTTYNGSSTAAGEWFQVQLPVGIKLTSYTIQVVHQERAPGTWYVLGSNDGSSWSLVDTQSGYLSYAWAGNYNVLTFTPQVNTAYVYYRLVTSIKTDTGQASWTYIQIVRWDLVGVKDDTVVRPFPQLLTAETTVIVGGNYGNGVYTCAESSDSATPAYLALDGNTATSWTTNSGTYPGVGVQPDPYVGGVSTYVGSMSTTVGGAPVVGAWLQVALPVAISVKQYTLKCSNTEKALSAFVLCGSLDGVTWVQIDTQSGFRNTYWALYPTGATFTPNSAVPYQFFRLIVTMKANTGQSSWSFVQLDEWKLLGSQPASLATIDFPPMSEGVAVPTRDFLNTTMLTVAIDSLATTPLDEYDMVLRLEPIS